MAEENKSQNKLVGTKITAVPVDKPEIGIDVNDTLTSNIVSQAVNSNVDISKLEGFSTVAQTREQIYQMIDTMAQDPILASYLKTVAEDAVETNDAGKVVWVESDDAKVSKYVTYLLDAMNVDKNAYHWMHSLTKYGDLYLRLYRKSDYESDQLFGSEQKETLSESLQNINEELKEETIFKEDLKEGVNIVVHEKGDHYVNYVESIPHPGEMFELTKFGKTMGFVKAPVAAQSVKRDFMSYSYMQYKMKRKDVEIYSATDFVHACLEDSSNRAPEEVDIFIEDDVVGNTDRKVHTYKVKRGQSELSSVFKIWRQLSLLENSALLNRITKSSVVRMISVEVGDMPKEQIGAHLSSLKSLMEQKAAIKTGESMSEYTNPGPIENNVYVPTHNGIGAVSIASAGGEFDPKQLSDLAYFQNKMFGALGVPKAFFGITDDGAGFNGGTSLAIQSSRYAKSVKRLQNIFSQAITDLINLMLFDRGLVKYINKFTIRMQAPLTQEELDRRDNKRNKVGVISDIMNQLQEIQNPVIKLKILKSLLADSLTDVEVISLLQEQIDELEKEGVTKEEDSEQEEEVTFTPSSPSPPSEPSPGPELETAEQPAEVETIEPAEGPQEDESYLPSPEELGVDLTVNQ
jgi:hypothetical protein